VDLGASNDLFFLDVPLTEPDLNYTSIGCTEFLGEPYNCPILILGTQDGDTILYNPETNEFHAKVEGVSDSQIGLISF